MLYRFIVVRFCVFVLYCSFLVFVIKIGMYCVTLGFCFFLRGVADEYCRLSVANARTVTAADVTVLHKHTRTAVLMCVLPCCGGNNYYALFHLVVKCFGIPGSLDVWAEEFS